MPRGWVILFIMLAAWLVVGLLTLPAWATGRPVTEATNEAWPCGYPYEFGVCMADRKVKQK